MTDKTDAIEVEPVTETAPTAAQKKSRSKQSAKPKRTFPQYTIEESRKIADAIKQFNAGNPWAPKEIAAVLKMGISNNFFYLTASSRDYDLTIGKRDTEKIELSPPWPTACVSEKPTRRSGSDTKSIPECRVIQECLTTTKAKICLKYST
jgi:hypothetical protein